MKSTIKRGWRRLAARQSFRKINELMFDCAIAGLGILNYENEYWSGEKFFSEKLLPLYLTAPNPVLMDVGGNTGDYTKMLKTAVPESTVWTFEPNPKTFAKMSEEIADLGAHAINKGLGSEEGILKFYDRKDQASSSQHGSLYREVIEELHRVDSEEMEVSITTLDKFCEANSIERINLLKIDTEGHELEVLKGARGLIEADKIDVLHIEFNEMNIVSRVFFRDLAKILPNHLPYRLLPQGAIPLSGSPLKTELFAFQNLIFVHRKFSPDKSMKPGKYA
ncbi:methyltransferase FkbM [Geomonas silvestris]|uniref:Methyltransferase FkbM n=1 Tax=Geomonas silvestris TaxID=2740184 RepID=A0A6V8MF59_9BACT|nr:FkbM family methyltransferase [Geomonas silvestris]GFO58514.1 methyltransferase FkbM [Geomonas silvestris]